jgi:hypothetical protein
VTESKEPDDSAAEAHKSDKRGQTRHISIELPPDLDAVYSNFAVIAHTTSEFVIDFACVLPNAPKGKVYARIVTTPTSAKALLRALGENLKKYESQHGEVRIPPGDDGLAAQFFGRVTPPPDDST